jgi:UDP-glucose 4-epimerase
MESMQEIKNVLVLGASSFIGMNFLEELLGKASPGTGITVFSRSVPEKLDLILKANPSVKKVTGDFRDVSKLKEACVNIDIVFHFISETFPHTSWEDPTAEIDATLIPNIRLLEILVKNKVKKIVYLSSAGTIYGLNKGILTEGTVTDPFSPHGIFKLTVEKLLNYYLIKHDLQHDIFRVSNAYGPYQNIEKGLGFINISLHNILQNGKAVIYGDGKAIRDFIYVKDVAKLLMLSMKKPLKNSDLYILSSGQEPSLVDVLDIMKKVIPERFEIDFLPGRKSDNKIVQLDNSKLLKDFGHFEFEPIESGILKTYQYIQSQKLHLTK